MKYPKEQSRSLFRWLSNLSTVGWLILVNIIFSIIGFIIFAYGKIDYIALKPSSVRFCRTLQIYLNSENLPVNSFSSEVFPNMQIPK